MTKQTVYTLGYSGLDANDIRRLARELNAVLVDIRYRAGSRNQQYNKSALASLFGDDYYHCREFGNENYRSGGPIKLAAPAWASDFIMGEFLTAGRNVILLCACKDLFTCHRWAVVQYLKQHPAYQEVEFENLTKRDVTGESGGYQLPLIGE